MHESFRTAGHYGLNPFGGNSEGRWALGSIDNSETSTRPGTYIDNAAACPDAIGRGVNNLRDLRDCRSVGIGRQSGFAVDDLQHSFCRKKIDVHRTGIASFDIHTALKLYFERRTSAP